MSSEEVRRRRVAKVEFEDGGRLYEYILLPSAPENPTHVVVPGRPMRGQVEEMKVAKVSSTTDYTNREYDGKMAYAISAFDLSQYEAAREQDRRRARIERALREKIESTSLVERVRALGVRDEETERLLEEYKSLL